MTRAAVLLLAAGLFLAACSKPAAPAPVSQMRFDCARGYGHLVEAITAEPGVKLANTPGEPYHYYSLPDGSVSYVVTLPSAPAHPAVFMQLAGPGGTTTIGCPYGDKTSYDRFVAYLKALAKARRG